MSLPTTNYSEGTGVTNLIKIHPDWADAQISLKQDWLIWLRLSQKKNEVVLGNNIDIANLSQDTILRDFLNRNI